MNATNERLDCLDVFRGVTIAAMILVNNPGSWAHVHPPLRHAAWHGCTPTDLIFPFFLFIVGVSMTLSFRKARERGAELRGLYGKIVRRSAILFALGACLHAIPIDLPHGWSSFADHVARLRIPGVLQRIGCVYLLAAPIALHLRWRGVLATALLCLAAYTLALATIPFPLVEDGTTRWVAGLLDEGRNLAAWVDDRLLRGHTWKPGPPLAWDPEGILSTVPAVATTLAGVLTGMWFQSVRAPGRRLRGLLLVGVLASAAGLVLDAVLVPWNKPLWTASYVVWTAGLALLVLGASYALLDLWGRRRWAHPFRVFGQNAIALFLLAGVVGRLLLLFRVGDGVRLKEWLFENAFHSWLPDRQASLGFAVALLGLLHAVIAWMHRRGIHLRV